MPSSIGEGVVIFIGICYNLKNIGGNIMKIEKAKDLFARKFHCSQAVFAAFAQELGITEEQALKIGACFGSGMRKGEVCGACTGALMALGLKFGQSNENDMDSRMKTN